jgi:hypothetical protein
MKLLAGILMMLSFSLARGQAQEDLSQYFDDGGLSNRKNILKTNLPGFALGKVGLNYERLVGSRIGLHCGMKVILPNPPVQFEFNGDPEGTGFGVMLGFRQYPLGFWLDAPEGLNWGISAEQVGISGTNGQNLTFTNFFFTNGINVFFTDVLMASYDVGVGPRREVWGYSSQSGNRRVYWDVALFVHLSLGVHF